MPVMAWLVLGPVERKKRREGREGEKGGGRMEDGWA